MDYGRKINAKIINASWSLLMPDTELRIDHTFAKLRVESHINTIYFAQFLETANPKYF